jgi:uncharacterized protein (TIGR03067 family)
MRRVVISIVAVVGCAASVVPTPAAPLPFTWSAAKDAARKEHARLQGTWYTVAIGYGGRSYATDRGDTITYEGNRYIQRQNGRVYQAGTFVIVDTTATPKQIEYTCTDGDLKGKRFRSIYTLDGDDHRICSDNANDNRPKDFTATAGFLRATKRQKD